VIRTTALWLVIIGLLGYSWKDWYKALCGLILLMAVAQHPDFPKTVLGIPGLNPWNLLLFNILVAWWVQRRDEGLRFDLPRNITVILLLYLLVVVIGFVRILGDTTILTLYYREGLTYFVNDYLVNTIKWVIPALLLYDGCRSEERFRIATFCLLAVFVLLGLQVAKWMPPQYALNADALERRSLKVLVSGVGYHRVNLSAMLSGASWAILCAIVIVPRGKRWLVLVTALFIVYAQMMTGGRAGYGSWVAVGLALSVLKWRRYLLLIPAAVALAMMLAPGVVGRAMMGFTPESRDTNKRLEEEATREMAPSSDVDPYTVTAGRSVAWPLIIEKIKERPYVGYGRQAMLRTGIASYLYDAYGELFPHPHNAYLELLLDNGVIGFVIVMSFYVVILFYSIALFLDRQSPSCSAIGGVSAALILGLLMSSMGSQTFYPREGWVCMWCAMMLMLRVRTERRRLAGRAALAAAASTPVKPVASKWQLRPAAAAAAATRVRLTPGSQNGFPRYPNPRAQGAPVRSRSVRPLAAGAFARPEPADKARPGFFSSKTMTDTLVWEHA
jgi:O-antigen ligase